MVSFDPETLISYVGLTLHVPGHDPVDWDAWLTSEALRDETNPSQILQKYIPQLYSARLEVSLPSDGGLQMAQALESEKEPTTTNRRTPSPGAYASVKCESTGNPPFLNSKNKRIKSPKPYDFLDSADYSQEAFLNSPHFEFLRVQDNERQAFHKFKPIIDCDDADQDTDCIQTICQIATGEILSQKQAREIKNCCGSLTTDLQSVGAIAALKSLLVDYHLRPLPRVDSDNLNSSMTACVVYLRYLSSITGSNSKTDGLKRRLVQIWIHIHFENHVSELKKSETNGLLLNRRCRAISTVARDSILQVYHGSHFIPRKADRDFLSDQCRWGERWWKIATCMGLGVVLFASEDLVDQIGRKTAFQNKMVDTLAIYFLNRYTSLIGLYRYFEPMAVGVMLGGNQPHPRFQLSIFPELLAEDEAFLSRKQEKWLIPNLKSLSRLAATHLISIQRS